MHGAISIQFDNGIQNQYDAWKNYLEPRGMVATSGGFMNIVFHYSGGQHTR
jgi:hypothetical protein